MRNWMLAGTVCLIVAISGCSWNGPEGTWGLKQEAQDALEARLKDPDSVKYGRIWVGEWHSIKAVCGFFNAKNSFGGYTGMRRFMYHAGYITAESDDNSQFNDDWSTFCEQY